jgi:hypothetical protein
VIAVVAIEPVSGFVVALNLGLDGRAVHEKNVLPAVVVVIDERHTARQAQIFHAGHLMNVPCHFEHDFLGDLLDRAGQIHVPLRDLGFGAARRTAENILKSLMDHPEAHTVIKIFHIKAK